MDAALNPYFLDQAGKSKPGGDDANRPHDGAFIGVNFIGSARQHIAAGRSYIFHKGVNGQFCFNGQGADAFEDEGGLNRGATGRVDDQRNRLRILHFEGFFNRFSEICD